MYGMGNQLHEYPHMLNCPINNYSEIKGVETIDISTSKEIPPNYPICLAPKLWSPYYIFYV